MEQYYIANTDNLEKNVNMQSEEIIVDATFDEDVPQGPKTPQYMEEIPTVLFTHPHHVHKKGSDFRRILLCEMVISVILVMIVVVQHLAGNAVFCDYISSFLSKITSI